jgi:hypothetical protein
MSGQKLKTYRVYMRRRGGRTRGRVDVLAGSRGHAERVGVKQCIETSYPDTKPAQWIVTLVEELKELEKADAVDISDKATIAGLEAGTGHLSALVDELRALLGRAMANFTMLHTAAVPDSGPDMDAIVPAAVFARFVDEDAALRYEIAHSAHGQAVTS